MTKRKKKNKHVSPQEEIIREPAPSNNFLPSIALIVLLGLICYFNSFQSPFIWDDYGLVKENKLVQSWNYLPQIFTSDILGGKANDTFYRPLQMLSYLLDYTFWKENVIGYHLTNTVFHILTGIGVFYLIVTLFNQHLLALLTSLLFVVHPIHTEAVTYISGRADPMVAFFLMFALIFYIKFDQTKDNLFYAASLFLFGLSLLTKEYALIFPILIIVYHHVMKRKINWKRVGMLFSMGALYLILRQASQVNVAGDIKTSFFERLPGVFVALWEYLRLLIFPTNLHMGYGLKLFEINSLKFWLGLVSFLLLTALVYHKRKSNAIVYFSVIWFFISLFPVSNLYPVNAYMAEHWLYLPSIGFCLILACGINAVFERSKPAAVVIVSLIMCFYSYQTIQQNFLWKEPESFYKRIIAFNPSFYQAYNNLGSFYAAKDDGRNAQIYYKKALEIKPNNEQAHSNLALLYKKRGDFANAKKHYAQALQINPDDSETHYNFAALLGEYGEYKEAETHYKKVWSLDPENSDALNNQGLLLYEQERPLEAMIYYKQAIETRFSNKEAHNNLANVYAEQGSFEDAKRHYFEAIRIEPNYIEAHNNLGYLFYRQGYVERAMSKYKRALELQPDYIQAHNNLGFLLFNEGKEEEALDTYRAALDIDPENLDALNITGIIHGKKGDYKQAEETFVKILKLKPNYISAIQNLQRVRALMSNNASE